MTETDYNDAFNEGCEEGFHQGYEQGHIKGYKTGYDRGVASAPPQLEMFDPRKELKTQSPQQNVN